MDATQTAWIVFLAGVVPAAVLALAGVAIVARRSLALKKRLDAYTLLPVVARIAEANATIAAHAPGAARAPGTIARLQSAITTIRGAREDLAASASTVKSMWRRAKP